MNKTIRLAFDQLGGSRTVIETPYGELSFNYTKGRAINSNLGVLSEFDIFKLCVLRNVVWELNVSSPVMRDIQDALNKDIEEWIYFVLNFIHAN